MTVRSRWSGRSSATSRSSSSWAPKCMNRPPLQVPMAVRVGSGITAQDGMIRPMDPRLGVLAFGDSITNGGGELQWGVALQSWALWTARGLGLPYTGFAVDGATAADVLGEQLPAFVERSPEDARYDVGCLYVGVNDVRAPDWDELRFEERLGAVVRFLASRCDRVLVCTIPLDLGRPRAGAARGGGARRGRARPAPVRRAQPRDGRRRTSDGVRPDRDRRARTRRARRRRHDGSRPPAHADRLRDDALEAPARRRDVRLPPAQAGPPGGERPSSTPIAREDGRSRVRRAARASALRRRGARAQAG